jgi:hypothetical protein
MAGQCSTTIRAKLHVLHREVWNSLEEKVMPGDGIRRNRNLNGGAVGAPMLSAGFYEPNAADYRDNISPAHLVRPHPADPSTFRYSILLLDRSR